MCSWPVADQGLAGVLALKDPHALPGPGDGHVEHLQPAAQQAVARLLEGSHALPLSRAHLGRRYSLSKPTKNKQ